MNISTCDALRTWGALWEKVKCLRMLCLWANPAQSLAYCLAQVFKSSDTQKPPCFGTVSQPVLQIGLSSENGISVNSSAQPSVTLTAASPGRRKPARSISRLTTSSIMLSQTSECPASEDHNMLPSALETACNSGLPRNHLVRPDLLDIKTGEKGSNKASWCDLLPTYNKLDFWSSQVTIHLFSAAKCGQHIRCEHVCACIMFWEYFGKPDGMMHTHVSASDTRHVYIHMLKNKK